MVITTYLQLGKMSNTVAGCHFLFPEYPSLTVNTGDMVPTVSRPEDGEAKSCLCGFFARSRRCQLFTVKTLSIVMTLVRHGRQRKLCRFPWRFTAKKALEER